MPDSLRAKLHVGALKLVYTNDLYTGRPKASEVAFGKSRQPLFAASAGIEFTANYSEEFYIISGRLGGAEWMQELTSRGSAAGVSICDAPVELSPVLGNDL